MNDSSNHSAPPNLAPLNELFPPILGPISDYSDDLLNQSIPPLPPMNLTFWTLLLCYFCTRFLFNKKSIFSKILFFSNFRMVKRKNEVKQEANAKQAKKTPVDEEAELQATLGEIMEVTEMPKMGEGMFLEISSFLEWILTEHIYSKDSWDFELFFVSIYSVGTSSRNEKIQKIKLRLGKWKNKTRTLIIGSRGLDYRSRHFMEDFRRMMAHGKADTKLEKKNERVCNIFFLKIRKKNFWIFLKLFN